MTDQPQGPTDPAREGSQAPPPDAVPPPPSSVPPPVPQSTPPAYDPGQPPAPPQQQGAYGYGGAPPAYGASAPNPYGGGYAPAPGYTGGRPMHPGSIGYVEQNFGPVADFGKRALAHLIDIAITLVGLIPMIIGIILLVVGAPDVDTDQFGQTTTSGGDTGLMVTGGVLIGLGALVSFGIWLWNRVFRMGRTGQSVGKRMIGLTLLDDKTGQPIGAGMSFLREVVHSIVNQVFYLSFLWMLWDTDKQTLGDKAVHSTVVVVPKS